MHLTMQLNVTVLFCMSGKHKNKLFIVILHSYNTIVVGSSFVWGKYRKQEDAETKEGL